MGVSAVGKKQDLIGRLLLGGFRSSRFSCVDETFDHEVDYYSGLKDAGLL